MKIDLKYRDKKFKLEVKKCNLFWIIRGLMFTQRERAIALLLFDFKESVKLKIHSYFVFFPFIAVWLDDKNKILKKRIVQPFTFLVRPEKPFSKLIEIPMNKKYRKIVGLLCSS